MNRLTAQVLPAEDVDLALEQGMYALFERYYAATSPDLFHHDLREKHHVIVLRDDAGGLRGFTTLAIDDFTFAGRPRRAVFSGDTIIDQEFWGEQALAFAWTEFAGRVKARQPDLPLYWFLICKGFRTYRYLPAMTRHFYPSWKEETAAEMQQLLDFLAHARFGDAYRPQEGLIRFPSSRGHLREPWLEVSERERARPDVAFFLARSPRHGQGEELACITELAADNLRPVARRIFERGLAA